jgi:hypothetical protein
VCLRARVCVTCTLKCCPRESFSSSFRSSISSGWWGYTRVRLLFNTFPTRLSITSHSSPYKCNARNVNFAYVGPAENRKRSARVFRQRVIGRATSTVVGRTLARHAHKTVRPPPTTESYYHRLRKRCYRRWNANRYCNERDVDYFSKIISQPLRTYFNRPSVVRLHALDLFLAVNNLATTSDHRRSSTQFSDWQTRRILCNGHTNQLGILMVTCQLVSVLYELHAHVNKSTFDRNLRAEFKFGPGSVPTNTFMITIIIHNLYPHLS